MSNKTLSNTHKAAIISVMREKRAASQSRVKMARHLLNMQALQREIAIYNVAGLQKAAAANTNKHDRIKLAALLVQHQVEKRAFLGALLKSVAKPAAKAIGGALAGSQVYQNMPSREGVGNTLDSAKKSINRAGNDLYYAGASRYNKVTNPIRQVGYGIQGFGQGLAQGAHNIIDAPGNAASYVGRQAGNLATGISNTASGAAGSAQRGVGGAINSVVDGANYRLGRLGKRFANAGNSLFGSMSD